MKTRVITALALIFGILLAIPIPSIATTVERLSLEVMARRAGRIIEGTVRGSRSYWTPNGKVILTATTIDVTDSIKGRSASSIEITTIGGQVGDTGLQVAGMARFRAGERTIVFVEESASYLTVLGLAQGKFTIANGQVSNSTAELSAPDNGSLRPYSMPLQTFKSEIRSILERNER